MLTEEQLDELATIITNRQEKINYYVLEQIARKIKQIGKIGPSDVAALIRMRATGSDVQQINQTLAAMSAVQEKEIQRIIQAVALDSYKEAKPFYDYRHKKFIPFKDNKPLQNVVKSIIRQTSGTMKNLSRSQAFMIRDQAVSPNKFLPTDLSETYQRVVDEAVQAVQSGVTDYNSAMRKTLQTLLDEGIKTVSYDTPSRRPYVQRLDTAVRRNVLDGIRAINQGVQDETGRQFGADGVELTVHEYPAEDHAPVQGHQFTNEEFEKMQNGLSFSDVKGRKFLGFPRAIGTLNCRHFTFSIIIGHAKPNYTDEQLAKILEENEKGYTYPDGQHLTMYECTQKMRNFELKIRRAKESRALAKVAGDKVLEDKYDKRVKDLIIQYKDFCANCGLKARHDKTRIVTK